MGIIIDYFELLSDRNLSDTGKRYVETINEYVTSLRNHHNINFKFIQREKTE